jgi:23S rRNA pseudouridine1911/1915/1917 synthase
MPMSKNTRTIHHSLTLTQALSGKRLDQALSQLLPDYSRMRIQQWIAQGWVSVNGQVVPQRYKVQGDEQIEIQAQTTIEVAWQAQAIALDIVFEDEDILVINKPAGLVVHPGAGVHDGTLVNALLHHAPALEALPRAGIIHRLDKDTSGLLVVTRSLRAHTQLTQALQQRQMGREYTAVVNGVMIAGGSVDAPIGRHPKHRLKMAVVTTGKPAITHYRVQQRFRAHSLLQVKLETGRTHQIRVHMNYIKHAITGDPVYGQRLAKTQHMLPALIDYLREFRRQALHASKLSLVHPGTQQAMCWEAPVPADMQLLIDLLQQDQEMADVD